MWNCGNGVRRENSQSSETRTNSVSGWDGENPCGRDFDKEAKDHARAAAARINVMFIEDGQDPAIGAGAGTMAMELTRWTQPMATMQVLP